MKRLLKGALARLGTLLDLPDVKKQQVEGRMLTAQIAINQMKMMDPVKDIADAEFKVFSQFGDDGILQYLIYRVNIARPHRTFVEFGVENYEESNTRFLLMNNNWRGLVLDGAKKNVDHIRASSYFWKHNLSATAAFIDAGNINDLLSSAGMTGEIGILSIDIDGNDYWVWESIHVVDPIIVVAEYNGVFGNKHPVSIPYDPAFRRSHAHYSNLYWGCSLAALNQLATKKGYVFVGCNSAGNNAYFIREDRMLDILPRPSLEKGFVDPQFKESRDPLGTLSYLSGTERLDAIRHLPLTDVVSGKTDSINNLYRMGSI
jgi:hypothetical protein